MLYLLRTYLKDGTLLKVGYADDIDYRLSQYFAHNPGIEKLDTRKGNRLLETLLHTYLHFLGYGEYKDEWYRDCPEMISEFSIDIKTIKDVLWKNRDSIFPGDWRNSNTAKWKRMYEILLVPGEELTGKVDRQYKERYLSDAVLTDNEEVNNFVTRFNETKNFEIRMKLFIESIRSDEKNKEIYLSCAPENFRNYYTILGPDKIKSVSYHESDLKRLMYDLEAKHKLKDVILYKFFPGDRLSRGEIKSALTEIYENLKISKTPKATDLMNYFEVRECKLVIDKDSGKRGRGYEIIKIKEE